MLGFFVSFTSRLRVLRILEGSRNSMGDRSFSHSKLLDFDQNIRNYSKIFSKYKVSCVLLKFYHEITLLVVVVMTYLF